MDTLKFAVYDRREVDEMERLFIETFSESDSAAEGAMVGRLARDLISTTAPDDLYGFVARDDQRLIACILLSRLRFESGVKAFILAPVAVRTDYHGKGIGQRLIRFGLDALTRDGVELVVTYGDPAFYSKVGFHAVTEASIPAPHPLRQPEGWQAQSLSGGTLGPIAGRVACADALNKPEYW